MSPRTGERRVGRVVIAIALMGIGLVAIAAALVPILFLKGDVSSLCMRQPYPVGAVVSESHEALPSGRIVLWPLGLQCSYVADDGGEAIVVNDGWSKTVAGYGGLAAIGFGGLLLRKSKRG